jgi:hypothetical protein
VVDHDPNLATSFANNSLAHADSKTHERSRHPHSVAPSPNAPIGASQTRDHGTGDIFSMRLRIPAAPRLANVALCRRMHQAHLTRLRRYVQTRMRRFTNHFVESVDPRNKLPRRYVSTSVEPRFRGRRAFVASFLGFRRNRRVL